MPPAEIGQSLPREERQHQRARPHETMQCEIGRRHADPDAVLGNGEGQRPAECGTDSAGDADGGRRKRAVFGDGQSESRINVEQSHKPLRRVPPALRWSVSHAGFDAPAGRL
jgi:hypothetical protein